MGWTPDAGKPYFIQSRISGQTLDVFAGRMNRAPIIQWPYHGGDNQRFVFEPAGDGSYFVRNVKSGLVFDIQGGSTAAGGKLNQYPHHGGDNQRFFTEDAPGGGVALRCKRSGMVLDIPASTTKEGTQIIQWSQHGGPNQSFTLRSAIPTTLRLSSVTCHQPASGVERAATVFSGVFSTISGAGVGALGAGMAVAGVTTGGTAIAVVGAAIGIAGVGSLVAGIFDIARSNDDLYVAVDGSKVWPGGKYHSTGANDTVALGLDLPNWSRDRTLRLWEYDSGSNHDPLTPTLRIDPKTSLWDQDFVVSTGNPVEDSFYSLTFNLR